MKVHHLNCGNLGWHCLGINLICHCLLIETPNSGLVLVDTGLGKQDFANPVQRLGLPFVLIAHPQGDRSMAAVEQIEKLGFKSEDVRHIVLTHMDLDHTGGLADFPKARIHVHRSEYDIALSGKHKSRYKQVMWSHNPQFVTYGEGGDLWFGFESIRDLAGLPPEILFVPTAGHSRGHTAVAIQNGEEWLLHAGDAYFEHGEVHADKRQCSWALGTFQRMNQFDQEKRLLNQDRLRTLAHSGEDVQIVCAHSAQEFPGS